MKLFNLLLQYLFLFTPLAVHLAHDAPEINQGKNPEHKKNAYALAALIVLMSLQLQLWALPHVQFWQFAFYAASIHFAFFNYALNRLRKPPMPFFYVGNGFFDFILKLMMPWQALLAQAILLFAGFSVYHFPNWYTYDF